MIIVNNCIIELLRYMNSEHARKMKLMLQSNKLNENTYHNYFYF